MASSHKILKRLNESAPSSEPLPKKNKTLPIENDPEIKMIDEDGKEQGPVTLEDLLVHLLTTTEELKIRVEALEEENQKLRNDIDRKTDDRPTPAGMYI